MVPPVIDEAQQEELRAAVQELPAEAGIGLANWNWKVMHLDVWECSGLNLCRSNCLNYPRLHEGRFYTGWDLPSSGPGSAWSRRTKPNGRPLWRSTPRCGSRREALAQRYSSPTRPTSGRMPSCGGRWVPQGEPALVDSTSPRRGEKASYYSAVCLETGEVEWMELEGNSNTGTSVAFLMQPRESCLGPLKVIWDNAPAHLGEVVREYLRTLSLGLRLVNPRFHGAGSAGLQPGLQRR